MSGTAEPTNERLLRHIHCLDMAANLVFISVFRYSAIDPTCDVYLTFISAALHMAKPY